MRVDEPGLRVEGGPKTIGHDFGFRIDENLERDLGPQNGIERGPRVSCGFVRGDREEGDVFAPTQLMGQLCDRGHLFQTGWTRFAPKIDNNDLASIVGQPNGFSLEVLQLEIRSAAADRGIAGLDRTQCRAGATRLTVFRRSDEGVDQKRGENDEAGLRDAGSAAQDAVVGALLTHSADVAD